MKDLKTVVPSGTCGKPAGRDIRNTAAARQRTGVAYTDPVFPLRVAY